MKPTSQTELVIAVSTILESIQQLEGSIDPDKRVGVEVKRMNAFKFRITFNYIVENRPVPPMVDPATFDGAVQSDYWFEWLTEESLARLVKDVYDAYNHIQSFNLFIP